MRHYLKDESGIWVARLGPSAFETIGGEVVNVALLVLTTTRDSKNTSGAIVAGLDVTEGVSPTDKAAMLGGTIDTPIVLIPQSSQLENPDARVTFTVSTGTLLGKYATATQGLTSGDNERFFARFWELNTIGPDWTLMQSAATNQNTKDGHESLVFALGTR